MIWTRAARRRDSKKRRQRRHHQAKKVEIWLWIHINKRVKQLRARMHIIIARNSVASFPVEWKKVVVKWLYHLTFQWWWFQWLLDGVLQCHQQTLTCITIYLPRIIRPTHRITAEHSAAPLRLLLQFTVVARDEAIAAADRPRGKRRAHPLSIFQIGYIAKVFSPKLFKNIHEFIELEFLRNCFSKEIEEIGFWSFSS